MHQFINVEQFIYFKKQIKNNILLTIIFIDFVVKKLMHSINYLIIMLLY